MTPDQINAGAFGLVGLIITYLFDRLNRMERRLRSAEQAIRKEQDARVRVCLAFVSVRDRLMQFARRLYAHGLISENEMREVEATPTVDELLQAPIPSDDIQP